jgi:hypothetical protein
MFKMIRRLLGYEKVSVVSITRVDSDNFLIIIKDSIGYYYSYRGMSNKGWKSVNYCDHEYGFLGKQDIKVCNSVIEKALDEYFKIKSLMDIFVLEELRYIQEKANKEKGE